ncbi:cytochrome P450 [Leucosporidium creatinivorum]|uniref:Cytochrome P450 n=1 Tax=Leucosporidium creatinivorum TaxID=106004 RepID=A0A1Y2CEX2_9BASI|nr:cytochrome P450 [Leucosporidium creatinivorum]
MATVLLPELLECCWKKGAASREKGALGPALALPLFSFVWRFPLFDALFASLSSLARTAAMIEVLVLLLALYIGWTSCRNLKDLCSRFRRSTDLLSIFAFLPRFSGFNLGEQYIVRYRHALFSSRGSADVLSLVTFFPPSRGIVLADATAIKHVVMDRTHFPKQTHNYKSLAIFGENAVTTEGEVWRRHRRIVGGSFTEGASELAWEETARIVDKDCIADDWERRGLRNAEGKLEVAVPSVVKFTLKIQLLVIAAAAFSHRAPWSEHEPEAVPEGQQITLAAAMHGVLDGGLIRLMCPTWAVGLPIKRLQQVNQAYQEFDLYLKRMITARKATTASDVRETQGGRRDLLGALVHANQQETAGMDFEFNPTTKPKGTLSDDEVLGNMFVIMAAGHETTAHALATTLQYLALHQDVQEKLLAHIDEIMPLGADASYSYASKLPFVNACFLEAMRLQPPIVVIPKHAASDVVIPIEGPGGEGERLYVPRGTDVYLDVVALHRNPKYWGEDCDTYKPERFVDAADGSYRWPREAFMGFSAGPRSCLGQRFSSVSATAVLALLFRKYRVYLAEDYPQQTKEHEPFKDKVERVMHARYWMSLTPDPVSVVFVEREKGI